MIAGPADAICIAAKRPAYAGDVGMQVGLEFVKDQSGPVLGAEDAMEQYFG